jgi:hypothetical protein
MNLSALFFLLAILSALFNIVITMSIVSELKKRNFKINFFFLRLYIPKYVYQYKNMTIKETGKAGNLFYFWITSINLAWILAVIGFILKQL